MPKNDNPHSIRLYDSIANHSDKKTAEKITHKLPLSKAADIDIKFVWAESICADLENEFDEITVKNIRMDCACGPEMGKVKKLKEIFSKSIDIDDFVAKSNKLDQGFMIEHKSKALFLIYPQCYCSCVKRIDKPISKTWCYCTLGYTKKMFEHILDRTVNVQLIESVKTGGEICKIKIT
jgi:predicted hydrocarbon binding protein